MWRFKCSPMDEPLNLDSIQALRAFADDLKAIMVEADEVVATIQNARDLNAETAQLRDQIEALEAVHLQMLQALSTLRRRLTKSP